MSVHQCFRSVKTGKRDDGSAPPQTPKEKSTAKASRATGRSDKPFFVRDLGEEEKAGDVEKFFPQAMLHLKASPASPTVSMDQKKRRWEKQANPFNVDGVAEPKDITAERSHFAHNNLDIRRNARERSSAVGRGAPSREEEQSPDILRLTGGNAYEHGLGISEEGNNAPADETREEYDAVKQSDVPVEITDMLKERLMELKTQKLQEDRFSGYFPKRLDLASDEEVRTAQIHRRTKVSSAKTSLAQLDSSPAAEGTPQQQAADFLDSARMNIPLSSSPKRKSSSRGGRDDVPEAAAAHKENEVYLLRTLPRAGFCSRREAEGIIASGDVKVNNVVERNPFRLVRAEDDIHVAGHQSRLRFPPPRLWMYHKPAHVIVSRNDVAGRALITKHAAILGIDHLIPVGSLPMRAHGLLLLTNDGELSQFLEDPRSMIQQTYLLRVRPSIDPVLAHKFNTKGITVDGKQYRGFEFAVNPSLKSRFSVKVKVRGETMPIYQLMKHISRTIERGGRIGVGPFVLNNLAVGSIREVAVPPRYMDHAGKVWKSFVERDWPFFRRQRIVKLRHLSRYRELTPKEIEELENEAYNEIQDALHLETSERSVLEGVSSLMRPLAVEEESGIPPVFPEMLNPSRDISGTEIIEDITKPVV